MSPRPPRARGERSPRLLGALFIAAGVNHFVMPRPYRGIVPPRFGDPARLVALSGVAEILGGVGAIIPRTRRLAGLCLNALLLAVFPANVYMALRPRRFRPIPRLALWARLPLQPLIMWWAWRATRSHAAIFDPTGPV
ncbi:MAG: DoxX family protein [Solirubrobacteraceae bacterium]